MKKIKLSRNNSILKIEGKKYVSENALTENTKYTTKEWVKHPSLGKYFLMVETEKEVLRLFQI